MSGFESLLSPGGPGSGAGAPTSYGASYQSGGASGSLGAPSYGSSPLNASSSIGAGAADDAAAGVVKRATFVGFLEWRSNRAKVLRQVPLSLLMYVTFAVGIILRARIGASYQFESQLLTTVVGAGDGFAPSSIPDWYDWVDGTLVQGVLPWTYPDGVTPLPPAQTGRLANGVGLIIGGIRLVQTRRAPTGCPLGSTELNTLYGGACYGEGVTADGPPFGNATLAEEYGVAAAFAPTAVPGDAGGAKYQLFLNPEDGVDALSAQVNGLRAAGWLDGATADVGVQVALLNGNVGLFGRVELSVDYTRGGLADVTTSVQSTPVDPYYGDGGVNVLFDMVLLLYWLYLLAGTLRRVSKALCGPDVRAVGTPWPARLSGAFLSYWRLLDIATTLSLIVTLGTWFHAVAVLADVRDTIDNADPTGPGSFSGGPSSLAQDLFDAHEAYASFEGAATATLVLLTLRMFKYFKYQPRLAALAEGIAAGVSDFAHVALIFGLILAMYGIVGHFAFGPQARDWRDVRSSMVAIFKLSVYEYDLVAMQSAFPNLADAFFCTFMIIVTNLFYWLSFASFFSSVDEARLRAHARGPSAFADLGSYVSTLPGEAYAWAAPRIHVAARLVGAGPCAARWLPVPPAAGVGTVALSMLRTIRKGGALAGMADDAPVYASLLAALFSVTPETAAAVMAEAAAYADAMEALAAAALAEAGGDDDGAGSGGGGAGGSGDEEAAGGSGEKAGAPLLPRGGGAPLTHQLSRTPVAGGSRGFVSSGYRVPVRREGSAMDPAAYAGGRGQSFYRPPVGSIAGVPAVVPGGRGRLDTRGISFYHPDGRVEPLPEAALAPGLVALGGSPAANPARGAAYGGGAGGGHDAEVTAQLAELRDAVAALTAKLTAVSAPGVLAPATPAAPALTYARQPLARGLSVVPASPAQPQSATAILEAARESLLQRQASGVLARGASTAPLGFTSVPLQAPPAPAPQPPPDNG